MKLNTVNVIEQWDNTVQSIHSFSDDADGNAEAEALFCKVILENGGKEEDYDICITCIEDGFYTNNRAGNDYACYLVHS